MSTFDAKYLDATKFTTENYYKVGCSITENINTSAYEIVISKMGADGLIYHQKGLITYEELENLKESPKANLAIFIDNLVDKLEAAMSKKPQFEATTFHATKESTWDPSKPVYTTTNTALPAIPWNPNFKFKLHPKPKNHMPKPKSLSELYAMEHHPKKSKKPTISASEEKKLASDTETPKIIEKLNKSTIDDLFAADPLSEFFKKHQKD